MKKETILVAERDRNAISAIRQVAKDLGCRCVVVSSPAALLKKAARLHPIATVVSIRLKTHSDGLSAAVTLRDSYDLPTICTGDSKVSPALARKARTELFAYVARPLDRQELQASLMAVLECERFEAVLQSHAEWRREMLNCMSDGLLAADQQGRLVFANPAAEKLLNFAAKDAVGHSMSVVLGKSAGGRQVWACVSNALHRGAAPRASAKQVVLRGRGGVEFHVDASASPIRYSSGKHAGVVLVIRDVSDRQVMTKRMLTEQKIKAVSMLARGIAHDFSAIVSSIGSHALSMVDSLISETRAHEDAVHILESTRRAQALVNRLLSLSRASDPPRKEPPQPISVAAAVTAAANLFHGTFKEKNIVFSARGIEPSPYVKGHGDHLLDVLISLFLNASEAITKGGSITVNVSVRKIAKPRLKLNPHALGGSYVVIGVSDTGSGMPRRVVKRLFEPFFTTKQTPMAKGLGLTVISTTVERWGGWVSVQSQPGHGTTFDLYIPEARVKHVEPKTASTRGRLVLVIDDKPAELRTFRGILTGAGYKVVTATNAAKGLAFYRKLAKKISVSIIDLVIADLDGKTIYEAIHAQNPEANIVMTSGFSRDYVRSQLGTGGWGFVQKPVDKNNLLDAVDRVMRRRPETVLDVHARVASHGRRHK